jgi:poly(hydroxyalkanoate) granule-associated protein
MAVKKKGTLSSLKNKASPEAAATAGTGFTMPDSVSHIWLAGLGALGKAQKEGPKLFESLIAEGTRLHRGGSIHPPKMQPEVQELKNAAASVSEAVRKQAGENWENLEHIFQDRVSKALEKLGAPGESRLAEMERTIDELKARLSKLEAEAKSKPVAKPAAARKTKPRATDKPGGEA